MVQLRCLLALMVGAPVACCIKLKLYCNAI
ncbi:Uncharacterised protein [Vibrio cholerae]|nr:Uncharacterised protein [Vibrio cholerae]